MRKIILSALFAVGFLTSNAQDVIYVCQGEGYTTHEISSLGDLTFSEDGTELTIQGTRTSTYLLEEIDSITFTEPVFNVEDTVITITYSGTTASVNIPSKFASDVTASVSGANVTITSATTTDEYIYVLEGSSSNGSFTINGEYKLTLRLNGLSLHNASGGAITVNCGKRIAVELVEGTTSTISDAASGSQDGAIYFKGHPEFEGGGTLNVTGNLKHAIKAKEYLQLKKSTGTINILGAVSDGIHCGEGEVNNEDNYFQMNGGVLNISGCGSDCIDSDDYGCAIIKGGTINLTVPKDGVGIKVDSIFTMKDGNINITCNSDLAVGIRIGYEGFFNGGTVSGEMSGNGTKGINAKKYTSVTKTVLNGGNLYFNGGTVDFTVSGGTYTADATKSMGVRAEGNLTMTAGTIKVNVTSSEGVGVSVKGTLTNNGGTIEDNSASSAKAISIR